MNDQDSSFSDKIREIEDRKLKNRLRQKRSAWLGLGVMGTIGWSVVLPLLAGTALGWWLDRKFPQSFSWTLTFMIGGLMLGIGIVYTWLKDENKEINKDKHD